jgi:hypothetical protein
LRDKKSVQWTVFPENEPTAVCAQGGLGLFVSMGGEVVEDHDGTRLDLRD